MITPLRQPDRHSRPNSGFTLVEVMVCSIIFVLFCVFFLNSAIASMRSHQLACNYYKAMTIARNRIQHASQFEYESIPLMVENEVRVDDDGNRNAGGKYQRTTLVSVYTQTQTTNLIQVTVQVHYPGARRDLSAKPVELSTLIAAGM